VQLSGRDLIAKPNDLGIRALKTRHTTVSRIHRMRIEPSIPHLKTDRLQILAAWITDAQP